MAGLIPPATIERVRSASDIVEVISGYLPLKRAGANFSAPCPFHKEKTPSFFVNPQRQTFHCFGCHKGGNVISFVMEYENLGFVDAVRRLAERAHILLEFENNPGQQQARHLKDTLLQIHEQITQRWQAALANDAAGQIARDYLQKRGVSEEAIKLFRLGYAPDAWDDTVNWSKSKDHSMELVEQAGLILKSEKGSYYDRFRGRLMFPICDEQGRVIGFSGRILSGDEKTAKYVNSPETPIFTKGKVFFGLDKSKRAILDAKAAIICEGQLDLIACFMGDVKNIVAPQGTALTADHARILKRYADEVILCFDSDNAGQNAAVRSLESLLAVGMAIRVATVPAPHDPDSFIKEKGGAAFQELINKAEGFFDFYLNRLCATNDVRTDKGRVTVVKAMNEALHKTGNTVLLDTYAQKTALRLSVSAESMRTEFRKVSRAPAPAFEPEENFVPEEMEEEIPPPPAQEFWLLKLLLQNDEYVEWVFHYLNLDWVSHTLLREAIEARFAAMSEDWTGVASWLTQIEKSSLRSLITEALVEEREIPDAEKLLKGDAHKKGVLQILRDKFTDRQTVELNQRLSQPGISESEAHEIHQQKSALRQLKQQPLSPISDV